MIGRKWKKVVFAGDLPDCEQCDDKWCTMHHQHFADCECIGPTQDGIMYKEAKGVLYGRKMTARERKKYDVTR
jgi:hypothetical protein